MNKKTTPNQTDFLHNALKENNHTLSTSTEEHILHYLHMMRQWNKVYNLTSILDPHEMIMLHILDSLAISPYLNGTRIIDIGTGAGLPGIPLALTHPEKSFVLLDSNNKKTRFLTQVKLDLKINNIEIVHSRCEDFKPRQGFDSILSRAFSSLKLMIESTQHLLNKDGQILAMKGTYPEQEIQHIPTEYQIQALHKLSIQGLPAERHLICLQRKN